MLFYPGWSLGYARLHWRKKMTLRKKKIQNQVWQKKQQPLQKQLQLQLLMLQKQAKKCCVQKTKVGLCWVFSRFCLKRFLYFLLWCLFSLPFSFHCSLISNISFDRCILFYTCSERRFFEEFTNLLDVQVREMKSMTNAISKLEGTEKFLSD